ncbi:hypothetical protein [Streptomyces naphthomycinicus]|uniref:hypothetical protein n=1 Tax=Streptomyces naphthomycinicus TaxID=2872625 RepID=UPI001CEDDC37|nr:hypothetical protein [Streptomyces sp. TML10]
MVVRGGAARLGCAVVVCGLMLAGCTSGGDGPGGPAAGTGPESAAGSGPSPTTVLDMDPAKLPRTGDQAAALVREVIARPSAFGPAAVRRNPYESDPRRWAVLGDDCVWGQRSLPGDVLASLTRHYEIPASGGKGPLRLGAVVTVHRSAEQADWENAEVLEEMMRCPDQLLRPGETLGRLTDVPASLGDSGNGFADDSLTETGTYTSDELGGPHPYVWEQTSIGPFTLAVSARGAEGWSRPALFEQLRNPYAAMRSRLRRAVERNTPAGTTAASVSPSPVARDGRR